MNTKQDSEVAELIRVAGFGSTLVEVHTERDSGEITWAKFKAADGYLTVGTSWGVESTVASVAAALAQNARRSGRIPDAA